MAKKIFITAGDPRGIGLEIIFKALNRLQILDGIEINIAGSYSEIKRGAERFACGRNFRILDAGDLSDPGRDVLKAIDSAVEEVRKNSRDSALVTAPVSKKAVWRTDKRFVGHTEYLARISSARQVAMSFISSRVKLSLLTTHLPLKEVPGSLSIKSVISHLLTVEKDLKFRFKINSPRIMLCSLNPHSGEGGLSGSEERDILIPAVNELSGAGLDITGPESPAHALRMALKGEADFLVSPYHDQLLPAVKNFLAPSVNMTMGLGFIRTSPDHGPAFDMKGKNSADYSAMEAAIRLACKLITDE